MALSVEQYSEKKGNFDQSSQGFEAEGWWSDLTKKTLEEKGVVTRASVSHERKHDHTLPSLRLPNPHQNTSIVVCSIIQFYFFHYLHLPFVLRAKFTTFGADPFYCVPLQLTEYCSKMQGIFWCQWLQLFPINFRIIYFSIHTCPWWFGIVFSYSIFTFHFTVPCTLYPSNIYLSMTVQPWLFS